MKTLAVLVALLAGMPVQAGFALEPEEAGRQARDDLDALMAKQRKEKDAAAKPEDGPEQTASSTTKRRQAPAPVESRIPTICTGCGAR